MITYTISQKYDIICSDIWYHLSILMISHIICIWYHIGISYEYAIILPVYDIILLVYDIICRSMISYAMTYDIICRGYHIYMKSYVCLTRLCYLDIICLDIWYHITIYDIICGHMISGGTKVPDVCRYLCRAGAVLAAGGRFSLRLFKCQRLGQWPWLRRRSYLDGRCHGVTSAIVTITGITLPDTEA